jgi:hypothetical protein
MIDSLNCFRGRIIYKVGSLVISWFINPTNAKVKIPIINPIVWGLVHHPHVPLVDSQGSQAVQKTSRGSKKVYVLIRT